MSFEAYRPHLKIKPEELATQAVVGLSEQLSISHTVTHGADYSPFDRAAGDTITKRVEGSLPIRQYDVRNDRTSEIVTDEYSEQTVNVTVSRERPYSALWLTDEQKDWDIEGWTPLIAKQTKAMGEYLERGVLNQIKSAPYELVKLIDLNPTTKKNAISEGENVLFNFFVDLQLELKRMRNPDMQMTAQVGYAIAAELMKNAALIKDQGTGASALTSASIGTLAGISFELNPHIPHDVGFLYGKSAVVVHSSVASVPNSVPFGATASADGWAVRWMMDYETGRLSDRSVIDCYSGYQYTTDNLTLIDGQGISHTGEESFFVRGAVFGLKGGTITAERKPGDGNTDMPGGNPESWLAKAFNGESIDITVGAGRPWSGFSFPTAGGDAGSGEG